MASRTFSTESYFQTQRPPAGLDERTDRMSKFVDRWSEVEGKRVVLVTSGGTTVPLEANTVRFLDNFSAGTRGATSAEYFLSQGYAVIFLHRIHSLRPFSRHYSHSLNPFLVLLTVEPGTSEIKVKSPDNQNLRPILEAYNRSQTEGTLLSVDFSTVNDYLWLLRGISRVMAPLGRRGMFYLAAAVSDFFLPDERTAEHKIQSGHGTLSLEMDQVPKVLKPLVQEWTPEGYIVSFKLETEQTLLIPKARAALQRYGHQIVIGNDLHRRKHEVVFVEPEDMENRTTTTTTTSTSVPTSASDGPQTPPLESPPSLNQRDHNNGSGPGFKETWLRLDQVKERSTGADEIEIESLIVERLVDRHTSWIEAGKRKA